MLSSLSYFFLGMCSGMWVISGGIYLGVLILSFISVLLFHYYSKELGFPAIALCFASFPKLNVVISLDLKV